ncbi:MAG TPA: hypothetical protein VK145_02630 [Candidatus Nanoarchaeia archaeon]|nr:hypothetical protein [Candidatus Nanoarchaeia archaeon]
MFSFCFFSLQRTWAIKHLRRVFDPRCNDKTVVLVPEDKKRTRQRRLQNDFALKIVHRRLFTDSVISNTTRQSDWPLGLQEFLKVTEQDVQFGVKSSLRNAGITEHNVAAKVAQVMEIFSKVHKAGQETVFTMKNRLRLLQLPRLLRNVLKGLFVK